MKYQERRENDNKLKKGNKKGAKCEGKRKGHRQPKGEEIKKGERSLGIPESHNP